MVVLRYRPRLHTPQCSGSMPRSKGSHSPPPLRILMAKSIARGSRELQIAFSLLSFSPSSVCHPRLLPLSFSMSPSVIPVFPSLSFSPSSFLSSSFCHPRRLSSPFPSPPLSPGSPIRPDYTLTFRGGKSRTGPSDPSCGIPIKEWIQAIDIRGSSPSVPSLFRLRSGAISWPFPGRLRALRPGPESPHSFPLCLTPFRAFVRF